MPKLAANLSMMFGELPFPGRFEAAAKAGFSAVEYLFPYDFDPHDIRGWLDRFDLAQALFNAPPGDWDAGERGIACLPGREDEFADGIEKALAYAAVLGNRRIHVMAGLVPEALAYEEARICYVQNLRHAARVAQRAGLTILVEPINTIDMPGYFVNYQEDGVALIEQIGESNVRLQFDCYHCQMMQGNVVATFRKLQSYIDHVQIAGVPGRHEPNVGELNYPYVLSQIDASGYQGFVGCEYKPSTTTLDGLGWISSL